MFEEEEFDMKGKQHRVYSVYVKTVKNESIDFGEPDSQWIRT